MEKISSEQSASGYATASMTAPTEKGSLSEVMRNTKRSGGNYGSLAKSQLQPTFYIDHKVESDDTMQRLALRYSIHVQDIKRVNKVWSDAELSLLERIFIPVNASQLSALRTIYPTLTAVQHPPSTTMRTRKSSINSVTGDDATSSIRSSDSSMSIPAATTTSSFQDYFSRIDQQIRSSKKSLQSMDDKQQQHSNSQPDDGLTSSRRSNDNQSDDSSSSPNGRARLWNNGRHKGAHHLSDNSVFVNITTQNSREKHVSAALERIQREKDEFDEL